MQLGWSEGILGGVSLGVADELKAGSRVILLTTRTKIAAEVADCILEETGARAVAEMEKPEVEQFEVHLQSQLCD